jgi:hypothetical protein
MYFSATACRIGRMCELLQRYPSFEILRNIEQKSTLLQLSASRGVTYISQREDEGSTMTMHDLINRYIISIALLHCTPLLQSDRCLDHF